MISRGIVCFQKVMGMANNLNIHNSDKERHDCIYFKNMTVG